jgi:Bacterial Ig domain
MTRSHDTASTAPRRMRLRRRVAAMGGAIAIASGVLVGAAAPAAHATQPWNLCDPMVDTGCPRAIDHNADGLDPNYTTTIGTKLTVSAANGLLSGDSGPASLRVDIADTLSDGNPTFDGNATIAVNRDGSFTYTPDKDTPFSGIDSFTYDICGDPVGVSDADCNATDFATVSITVNPIVRPDTYSMRPGQTLTVDAAHGVLANDVGIDPLSVAVPSDLAHDAQHGTLNDLNNGAFSYVPDLGFQGVDTFQYSGLDINGDNFWNGTVTIHVDGTPPVVSMSAPLTISYAPQISPRWSATDPGGVGVWTYDAQYQIAPWNGPFSAWTTWKSATAATTATLAGTYGRTFCFHVRARDRVGNVSPWVPRCTSVPLRATSLSYTKYWTRLTNPVYFSGVAFSTNRNGQSASLASVQGQHMWLLATKCAACGTVQVRWNNVPIANVNLKNPVTVRHVAIPIAAFATPKAGSLRFYNTSPNGRLVIIEGLAILRG